MRWKSDLRDDEANGHLVVKRTLEGAGVDEEECLSEILRIENGAAAGKVKLDGRIMQWGRSTQEGTIYRTRWTRANLTYFFAASERPEGTQVDMVTVRTIIQGLCR